MAEITNKGGSPVSSASPKGTTAPAATSTTQAQPATSDPEYEAWQESGSPGWGWSSEGGWTYDGESVPSGPTTEQGKAYDASKDPALTGGDGGGSTPAPKTEPKTTQKVVGGIPTVPDQPGGQVATVDGKQVYIAGSTMRDTYGFETPEQYSKAQSQGLGARGGAWFGPLSGGEAAVENIATQYNIPEDEARRLMTLAWETNGRAPELSNLTQAQRDALQTAALGGSPYQYAQELIAEGSPVAVETDRGIQRVQLAPTPQQQQAKYEAQTVAMGLLSSKGLLDAQGQIDPKAYASKDKAIRQALYDIGLSEADVAAGRTFEQAHIRLADGQYIPITDWNNLDPKYQTIGLNKGYTAMASAIKSDYDKWASQFTPIELKEIQSGRYQVLDFDTNQFVAVPKKVYEEREALYGQYPEAGTSPGKVSLPKAIAAQQARYEAQQTALQRLSSAGFVDKLPEGVYMKSADTPPFREYTIPAMAEFVRKNPDGAKTLRDAGFDNKVLSEVAEWNKATGKVASYLDKGVQPTGTGLSRGLGLSSGEISALGRAMDNLDIKPVSGSYVVAYRQLGDDQKRAVAVLFDKDWTKGNAFSALAADIENISSKNLALQLLVAPIQPITTPIGKQLTLPEAKAQLAQTYDTELSELRGYVKPDGTFDVKKLDKLDPEKVQAIAEDIGYDSADNLKAGLEYYNYGTRVSAKEWTMAGLVAALDVISLGAIGGAPVLATIPGRATASGVQLGLAALVAPDVVKTFKSPTATTGEKALGAGILTALTLGGLASIPLSRTTLARLSPLGRVKISEDIVATNPVVWKGVKIGNNPVIGLSEGRLVVGVRGIKLPPLKEWNLPKAEGTPFEPRTGLEAKVLVNKTALERAGMTGEQARDFTFNIERTLEQVHKFAGKKSPNMNADLLSKPIDTFSEEGVEAILKWAVKNKDIVDRVFGSSTMRPQFTREALQEWLNVFGRKPGDIDMLLKNVTPAQAEAAVKDLVAFIRANSKDRPWVSADRPTLVENFSRSTGAKRHGIDVHYEGEPTLTGVETTPSRFADMVYGMEKIAPAVKVKLKGVGEVQVSRLSETGIGKTEQVLGWRRDPKTGDVILKTEAHRLKDYADLYEIIKTYNGKGAADDWASEIGINGILEEISAKATGASRLAKMQTELDGIVKNISPDEAVLLDIGRKIQALRNNKVWPTFEGETTPIMRSLSEAEAYINRLLESARTRAITKADVARLSEYLKSLNKGIGKLVKKWSPRDMDWVWTFSPSKGARLRSVGAYSPVVNMVSTSMISALRSPVVGASSTGSVISVPSQIAPSLAPSLVSPKVAPSTAPSVVISPTSPSPVVSPSVPGEPPSVSVITSPTPPSGIPSPTPPSPAPSPVPSPVPPSPVPSPTPPSPVPSPRPTPPSPYPPPKTPSPVPATPEKPPTSLIRMGHEIIGKEAKLPSGSIAWKQGAFWKYIPPPYDQPKPITLARGITPMGARFTDLRTTKETIQKIGESDAVVPDKVSADLGITDLFISNQAQDIDFTGGGLQTDVGERIPTTAQGMSVNGAEPKGHYYAKPIKERHSVSRTADSKEIPERSAGTLKDEGINRPQIAEDTEAMVEGTYEEPEPVAETDDFNYEALDELGPEGSFFDESEEFIRRFNGESKNTSQPKNRAKMKRIQPKRGRDIPPTMMGGIR